MTTAQQTHSPRELLVPYFDRLRSWCVGLQRCGATETPQTIKLGDRTVTLDPWEIERLIEALVVVAGAPAHSMLVAEIVAVLLKCSADSERFSHVTEADPKNFYRLQAELMLDSNLGNSAMRRIQSNVELLIGQGSVLEARQLTDMMHKLRRVLSEVNHSAGVKPRVAPVPSAPLRDPRRSALDDLLATDRPAGRLPKQELPADEISIAQLQSVLDPIAPATHGSPRGGRTVVLSVVFALSFALWVFVGVGPRWASSKLPVLTANDVPAAIGAVAVHSRWPTLYVDVRAQPWSAADEAARRAAVTDLVERASGHGFTSLLVRTLDGVPVVQWWDGGRSAVELHRARRSRENRNRKPGFVTSGSVAAPSEKAAAENERKERDGTALAPSGTRGDTWRLIGNRV